MVYKNGIIFKNSIFERPCQSYIYIKILDPTAPIIRDMLSTAKDHQIEVDIGNGGNSAESQGEEADESEVDELDLFPGGLELPPMRSPRGIKNDLLFLFGEFFL